MDPYMIPFAVRDALLCLFFLLGMIAGILAITRNQRKIGTVVTTGFLLLGIDPASEFIIFNLVSPNSSGTTDYAVFNWAYACISIPATILGILCLMAAIFFGVQLQGQASSIASEDVVYSPDLTEKTN